MMIACLNQSHLVLPHIHNPVILQLGHVGKNYDTIKTAIELVIAIRDGVCISWFSSLHCITG